MRRRARLAAAGGTAGLLAAIALGPAAIVTIASGCAKAPLPAAPQAAIDFTPPAPAPTPSASASAPPKPRPPLETPYERWRIAIEVYAPRATPGASIALDEERRGLFAKYFIKLHEKVHPIFSEALVQLDEGGPRDALANAGLAVEVELAIDGVTGKVVKYGVVRRSEVVDFDAVALDAIKQAQPFDPPPERLRSPDGNVYVRWTFRRDASEGCSTRDAQGFVLKKAPWPP